MRRGQIQTLEPVIIVIMLAIIFGIGLLFYVRLKSGEQTKSVSDFKAQEDLQTLAVVASLPELSCPKSETRTNCIDAYKALAFADMMRTDQKARTRYYPLFGRSRITISWIYLDESGNQNSLELYRATDSGNVSISRAYFTMFDPVKQQRMFANMTVERER